MFAPANIIQPRHFHNPAGRGAFPNHGVGAFWDCEFYGAGIATYLAPYYFTNCLFWRVQTTYWDQNDAANCALLNCTFYNGFLSLYRTNWQDASFWNIQNTAFDGTAIDMQDNHNGDTNYATIRNNAYNVANSNWLVQSFGYPVTNKLEVVSAQDILTNGFNWQSGSLGDFYLPTNSPLIDAGSDTVADVGLTDYTTQTSQIPDTGTVDIGYHYATFLQLTAQCRFDQIVLSWTVSSLIQQAVADYWPCIELVDKCGVMV